MSHIYEIVDGETHDNFIESHPKVVIFFGSQNCGHCRHMIPVYEELSNAFPNIAFAHVEVSRVDPKPINLEGVPTFAIYNNQVAVNKVVGARENELRECIGQLVNY
jgi:thioredoxin 1